MTGDGEAQGAMACRIDALSFLDAAQGAVFIDRLATAPRNREWLVEKPHYRGIGEGLILHAVAQSYELGLNGRVTLLAFDTPRVQRFYKNRGFQHVGAEEGMEMFELIPATATDWLRKEGYDL